MSIMYNSSEVQLAYQLDKNFYADVRAAKLQYKLVTSFIIAPHSGRAFLVQSGQIFKVIEEEGAQIGTVALWNAHNSRESFNAMLTWFAEAVGIFIGADIRLWSRTPWFSPMATCIEDTVTTEPIGSDYHHHWAGTHCNAAMIEMRTGHVGANSCHANLLKAVEPFNLKEGDIRDSISVHQKVYLDARDGKKLNILRSDSKRGDYVSFFAEIDLLVAVSVCPYGDGLSDVTVKSDEVRPLRVEVYETGIQPKEFRRRSDWRQTWKGRWEAPRG